MRIVKHIVPGLGTCCADPAQSLTTSGEELVDVDHLPDRSTRET